MKTMIVGFISLIFINISMAKEPDFISTKGPVSPPKGAIDLCERYEWACFHSGKTNPTNQLSLKKIQNINRSINRRYSSITDKAQYGKEEFWAPLTRLGGDCEDFALTKKKVLIQEGAIPERLLMTTVLDRQRNSHAVLIVLTDQGDYVLDNLTNSMKLWNRTGYIFLRTQNSEDPEKWEAIYKKGE